MAIQWLAPNGFFVNEVDAIEWLAPDGSFINEQPSAAATVTSLGGLHHIMEGMGDTGEGARVPQALHTIEHGISA